MSEPTPALRYANEDDVLALLQMDSDHDEFDGLVRLENGLCDVLDEKVGRSFGVAPVAETRSVNASESPRLVLSTPVRSIAAIETGGSWDGMGWQDGEALDVDRYRLTNQTRQGFFGIDLVGGIWSGVVRVTGIWGDQPTDGVPDDIREVMTDVAVKEWHRRHASPAGEIGPDGLTVRPANPWGLDFVKTTIAKYRVVKVLV